MRFIAAFFAAILAGSCLAAESTGILPNADFTAGADMPDGWRLTGGEGRWVDRQLLEVTGRGEGANQWRCDAAFAPGGLYRFAMRARSTAGTGCVTSGPAFANYDWQITDAWQDYGFIFRVPDGMERGEVRVGQWEARGTFQFDRVAIVPVVPVFRRAGKLVLGEGEMIRDGQYRFSVYFGGAGGNFHRPLQRATATFNTNRWCFHSNSEVVYRFHVPQAALRNARVELNINHYSRGRCEVELSTDGQQWHSLTTGDKVGTYVGAAGTDFEAAEALWLRLRATKEAGFQVDRIEFTAALESTEHAPADASPVQLVGHTRFADVETASPELAVDQVTLDDQGAAMRLEMVAHQTGTGEAAAKLGGVAIAADGAQSPLATASAQFDAGRPAGFAVDLPPLPPGRSEVRLALAFASGETKLRLPIEVHEFYRSDYGQRVGAPSGDAACVWWCDATRKIARQRLAPQASGAAATLGAARNDREAVQVVVRAEKPLAGLTATVDALKGPGGAEISGEQIKILRVAYHFVHHPTDKTGVCDWWPDALPPLDAPVDVPAGQNQPLWVLVHVPKTATAGDYEGMLRLKAEGWSADVPLRLRVWDFTLPDRNHLATAFGLSPETVFEYHQLKTDADKRRVLDMYHESFGEHRISPYDPAPLDPIGVKFLPDATPPRAEVDFARFEAAAQRAFDRFGFSHFMLHMQGMGGGTFHERYDPTIGRYTADSPQYQGAFASYVEQLQKHLDRKGWLGREYIYWFDEPDPKDYQFVRTGMQRIKQHAPRLTTMLTEEPCDELAGAIDIWCPVTFNYVHADAQRRKAAGERIWWYVCCGPKAPFCTLFIDHPATELRVWLWQTWQHDVDGILIWSANYWHSDTAFPDAKQNPHDDPMGYVSGYGVPKGTKQHWGNGDGRFVYPPLRAAVPGHAGDEPVIEPPVSSIRWEMLREGIEDWEYLYMLRELLRANPGQVELKELLKVPADITTNMTTFTADPAPIYQRRQRIAEAIEQLSKARP